MSYDTKSPIILLPHDVVDQRHITYTQFRDSLSEEIWALTLKMKILDLYNQTMIGKKLVLAQTKIDVI